MQCEQNKKGKQRIVIIVDSHSRNCAGRLHYSLGTNFKESSYVNLGAGMSVTADTVEEEIIKHKSDDVVVV